MRKSERVCLGGDLFIGIKDEIERVLVKFNINKIKMHHLSTN